MANLWTWLRERLFRPAHEPEYEETVAHDTVMVMIDGKLQAICEANPRACDPEDSPPEARACRQAVARGEMEVTADDPEEGQ